jgi:hypothetical protein
LDISHRTYWHNRAFPPFLQCAWAGPNSDHGISGQQPCARVDVRDTHEEAQSSTLNFGVALRCVARRGGDHRSRGIRPRRPAPQAPHRRRSAESSERHSYWRRV